MDILEVAMTNSMSRKSAPLLATCLQPRIQQYGTHTRLASGYRNYDSSGLNNVGGNGNWWSFAPYSQSHARNLSFYSGSVYPLSYNRRADGFGVWAALELH